MDLERFEKACEEKGLGVKKETTVKNGVPVAGRLIFQKDKVADDGSLKYGAFLPDTEIDKMTENTVFDFCDEVNKNLTNQLDDTVKEVEEACKSFEKAKDKLMIRIVQNTPALKDYPHDVYPHDDSMALVPYINFTDKTVPVSNGIVASWNVSVEDVMDAAYENTIRDEMVVESMPNFLSTLFPQSKELEELKPELDSLDNSLFIVTNKNKIFGAVQAFAKANVLSDYIGKDLDDFYIIPSSVHEALILPTDSSLNENELKEMIRDVNRQCVAPHEVLADHPLHYKNGKIHKV